MCAKWTATLLQFCIWNLFLKLRDKTPHMARYESTVYWEIFEVKILLFSQICHNLKNLTTQNFLHGNKYLDKDRTSSKIYSQKVSKWRILENFVPQKFPNICMMPYLRNKEVFIYSTIQLQWYILHSLFNIMTFTLTDFNYL